MVQSDSDNGTDEIEYRFEDFVQGMKHECNCMDFTHTSRLIFPAFLVYFYLSSGLLNWTSFILFSLVLIFFHIENTKSCLLQFQSLIARL